MNRSLRKAENKLLPLFTWIEQEVMGLKKQQFKQLKKVNETLGRIQGQVKHRKQFPEKAAEFLSFKDYRQSHPKTCQAWTRERETQCRN